MTENEFDKWLLEEAEMRGWSLNELGRRAGISSGTLSLVINGLRGPGVTLCRGLADAFGIPPVMVFRKAGLLPPIPAKDATFEDLLYYWQQLEESEQRIVLRQIIGLVAHDTKETIRERLASIVHRADVSVLPVGASVLPVMPDLVQRDEDASPASDLDGLPTGAKAGA